MDLLTAVLMVDESEKMTVARMAYWRACSTAAAMEKLKVDR